MRRATRKSDGTPFAYVRHCQRALPAGAKWEDYTLVSSAHVHGNNMLDVSFVDAPLLELMAEACELSSGDVLSLRISSFPTFPAARVPRYVAPWTIHDAVDGLVASGQVQCSRFAGPGGHGEAAPLVVVTDDGAKESEAVAFDAVGRVVAMRSEGKGNQTAATKRRLLLLRV